MGNEAIVRGAVEAGVKVAAGYPGTPSSEIIEILSKTALENELKVLLSGRIITQEVYGELFTNAKTDIHKAKLLSQQIIEEFAMSDEYFSTHVQIENLLQNATLEVKSLLSKLRTVVDEVRDYLLKNESITPIETKRILDDIF